MPQEMPQEALEILYGLKADMETIKGEVRGLRDFRHAAGVAVQGFPDVVERGEDHEKRITLLEARNRFANWFGGLIVTFVLGLWIYSEKLRALGHWFSRQ